MKVPPRRFPPLTEINLTSLADIAFNVIVFMILTTSFLKGSRNVELPTLPPADKSPAAITVTLDADGKLQFDGQDVDTPEALHARLRQRLEGYTDPKAREVKLRCDARLTQQVYRPVIEAIADAGGIIAVIHQPGGAAAPPTTPAPAAPGAQP